LVLFLSKRSLGSIQEILENLLHESLRLCSISINILSELFTEYSFNRDLKRFEDGISEKLGFAIYYISASVVNLILAFTLGWKLTFVVLAFAPLLAISTGVMTKVSETQFVS
jgi:ABC-type multidrug transport system fused ATPase/permease subunit